MFLFFINDIVVKYANQYVTKQNSLGNCCSIDEIKFSIAISLLSEYGRRMYRELSDDVRNKLVNKHN